MEVFLSYRFTGEDPKKLNNIMDEMKKSLSCIGFDTFCSIWLEDFFVENEMSPDQIYEYCNNRLGKSDIFLAFIKSEAESKGMKMELDEAIKLKKTIILAIKKGLDHSNFREKSDKIIEFGTIKELYSILKTKDILKV